MRLFLLSLFFGVPVFFLLTNNYALAETDLFDESIPEENLFSDSSPMERRNDLAPEYQGTQEILEDLRFLRRKLGLPDEQIQTGEGNPPDQNSRKKKNLGNSRRGGSCKPHRLGPEMTRTNPIPTDTPGDWHVFWYDLFWLPFRVRNFFCPWVVFSIAEVIFKNKEQSAFRFAKNAFDVPIKR